MATYTQTSTQTNNGTTTKTTVKYNAEKKAFAYTIIGDDIKADWDFLQPTGEIMNYMNEFLSYIQAAGAVTDAFNFNDTHRDIADLYTELEADVKDLESSLQTLHSAFMTDIDNVNAELKTNFGYWVGGTVNEASRTTTTI